MIHACAWLPETGFVADVPPSNFKRLIDRPDAILWVDIEDATPEEFALLRDPFNVNPLAVEDCRDFTALPKAEEYEDYVLVVLHRVQFDETTREMQLKEIDFLVGRNWIVSVRGDSSVSVASVSHKLKHHPEILKEGPARLMAEIIEAITARYFPTVEFLEREIDVLEEEMMTGTGKGDPFGKILSLRHTVVALRRSLVPQREVIHRVAKEEFKLIAGHSAHRLRTTHDELAWILTELEIHRELLTSAFEGHAAMASNRLAEISNRMNRVMEKLTRFTTVFMPLTLITGIYGMNFEHMPELKIRWFYPLLLVFLVITGFALSYYFKFSLPPAFDDPGAAGSGAGRSGGTRIVRKAAGGVTQIRPATIPSK